MGQQASQVKWQMRTKQARTPSSPGLAHSFLSWLPSHTACCRHSKRVLARSSRPRPMSSRSLGSSRSLRLSGPASGSQRSWQPLWHLMSPCRKRVRRNGRRYWASLHLRASPSPRSMSRPATQELRSRALASPLACTLPGHTSRGQWHYAAQTARCHHLSPLRGQHQMQAGRAGPAG